jgi:hypothetical protein
MKNPVMTRKKVPILMPTENQENRSFYHLKNSEKWVFDFLGNNHVIMNYKHFYTYAFH